MNQRPAVLLLFPAALAGITAVFFYATAGVANQPLCFGTSGGDVEKNAARSAETYLLLKKQRRDLRTLSDYVLPVPKGVQKSQFVNSIESTAGSARSGRHKTCTFRHSQTPKTINPLDE